MKNKYTYDARKYKGPTVAQLAKLGAIALEPYADYIFGKKMRVRKAISVKSISKRKPRG